MDKPCIHLRPTGRSRHDNSTETGFYRRREMNLLKNIALVWTQYRAFQAALAELQGYSDRELRELGLTHADIAQVAYAESERRVAAHALRRAAAPVAPAAA